MSQNPLQGYDGYFIPSSPKAQGGNDTNICIYLLPIIKFLFKVVWQNSKISKYQLKKKN